MSRVTKNWRYIRYKYSELLKEVGINIKKYLYGLIKYEYNNQMTFLDYINKIKTYE